MVEDDVVERVAVADVGVERLCARGHARHGYVEALDAQSDGKLVPFRKFAENAVRNTVSEE